MAGDEVHVAVAPAAAADRLAMMKFLGKAIVLVLGLLILLHSTFRDSRFCLSIIYLFREMSPCTQSGLVSETTTTQERREILYDNK